MSETADPHPSPTRAPRVADPTREAALQNLAESLAVLGDDASRATRSSRDVRLHIVACQAEHLAGDVRTLIVAWPGDHVVPEPAGYAASTRAARRAYEEPALQPLPTGLGASLRWLLQLAEAAVP